MQTNLYSVAQNTSAGTDTAIIRRVMTEPVCAKVEALGLISPDAFAGIKNQKAKKHLARSLNFIVTGDLAMFDRVIAGAVLSCCINPEGTRTEFASVHFSMGAVAKAGGSVEHMPGIGSAAIRKALGRVGPGTIKTQTSRTLGQNGLFTVLGATVRDANGFTVASAAHPFIVAFARRLSTISEHELLKRLNVTEPLTGNLAV
jgi:hypothetical protein